MSAPRSAPAARSASSMPPATASADDGDRAWCAARSASAIAHHRGQAGRHGARSCRERARPCSLIWPRATASSCWTASCRRPIAMPCRRARLSWWQASIRAAAHDLLDARPGPCPRPLFPRVGRRHPLLLRGGRDRSAGAAGAEQDRPCAARPRSRLRPHLAPAARGRAGDARWASCSRCCCSRCTSSSSRRSAPRSAGTRTRPICIPGPSTVTGFWIALDDADRDNGCLMALPGGHRGPLRQRFHRVGDRLVTDDARRRRRGPPSPPVALEARRGTLVVLHGLLPHASAPNRSARPRHAYALHLIDGRAEYPADNWLQRPDLPLRGFA